MFAHGGLPARVVIAGLGYRGHRTTRPRNSSALHLEDRVEVKIGVLHTPREIVLESAQTSAEVEELVSTTIASGQGGLALTDERGR